MFKRLVILLILSFLVSFPAFGGTLALSGVPEYYWWYGCSPTSGGMLVGYWDAKGYEKIPGDALAVSGNYGAFHGAAGQSVRDIIASPDHISDYWGADSGTHVNNSIADFMGTSLDPLSDGGTWSNNIPAALVNFQAWDNPATAVNDSYTFNSSQDYTTDHWAFGTLDFQSVVDEIDAGRPMILNTVVPGGGHSIVAFGYEDNPGTANDWFAVRDTWNDGSTGVTSSAIGAKTSGGYEWWPWITVQSGSYYVYGGIVFVPVGGPPAAPGAPEPGSMVLFLIGAYAIKRRKMKSE